MYFEISDGLENTDVHNRMVMHEFVLLETQPSTTTLKTFEMLHVAKVVPFVYHCEKIKIFPF